MSYVSAGGSFGLKEVLHHGSYVVPFWRFAEDKLNQSKLWAGFAVVAGVVTLLILIAGVSTSIVYATQSGFSDSIGWRGMGAAGTRTIQRSDSYAWKGSPNKEETFLNHGVGPEFVEQPNYLLGQEDLQRTALRKYSHLKASGAAVSDWPTFWAAYKAENADDLSASMYDFGADGFKGTSKDLRAAAIGGGHM